MRTRSFEVAFSYAKTQRDFHDSISRTMPEHHFLNSNRTSISTFIGMTNIPYHSGIPLQNTKGHETSFRTSSKNTTCISSQPFSELLTDYKINADFTRADAARVA